MTCDLMYGGQGVVQIKPSLSTVGTSLKIPEALDEAVIPQQIRLAESSGDLAEICLRICRLNGFSNYCLIRQVEDNSGVSDWVSLLDNWPAGLTDVLAALLSEQLAGRPASQLISAAPRCLTASEQQDNPLISQLAASDLKYSLLFRVHRAGSGDAVMCFSGDRHAASEMELMSLQFYAMLVYDRLMMLTEAEETRRGGELSPRELECLRWIAKGKTSSEIGIILGLSENTINNYIVNACRKMGAVNRLHAVYLSLKRGLIS